MPDLKITVTGQQWTRVKAAFKPMNKGVSPTAAFMQAWILGKVRHEVEEFERKAEAVEAETRAQTTLTGEGW